MHRKRRFHSGVSYTLHPLPVWMERSDAPVGAIYGDVASTHFDVAVSDPSLKRLDYVETHHEGQRILGLVESVTRRSRLSHEDALQGSTADERLAAHVDVIGYLDGRGRVQTPRTPFPAGATVRLAEEGLVTGVLGLEGRDTGAYLGHVKGFDIPVRLDLNTLAQKHISVLAKTGAGKSYTVGVILEEFLQAGVPLVILDPHGEYSSLRNPNMEDKELDAMVRYGVKPKSFQKAIQEFAIDTHLNPDAEPLRMDGLNLEAREIVDLLPSKLSGGQVGVLYQAVKDVSDVHPAWTLQDVMDAVGQNKSNAKWNVLNTLEALQATGVFHPRGTPPKDLVRPGQATIINLKGVPPDVQEVVAARLSGLLWTSRKRGDVPPHILVVEEAHNFCPERGVGNAVSGPVLRTIASEGRKFGMGLVIVSQRPAKIDKNVLSQCNTQVVLKVTNPNDLKAITASVEGITSAGADEVQRLPVGVALVAGGGLTQPVFVDVRPRLTRHGGASIQVVKDGRTTAPDAPPRPRSIHRTPEPAPRRPERESGPDRQSPAPPKAAPDGRRTDARKRSPTGPDDPPPEAPLEPSADTRPPASPPPSPKAPQETTIPTPPKRRLSKEDEVGMLRVATRIGVFADTDATKAKRRLEQLAVADGRPKHHFTQLYADIAKAACRVEAPACIRCPMRGECQYHAVLQGERQKKRGVIRRLWSH